ncbi:hypothetical protein bcere0017_48170 [Bacillus cereus Rock1-3]|nr:hypothetical protein bcere0017_48170 [Bacillus cereus Rock1-3]EEL37292.1 hypothetical protein bcere0020_53010 [Bacillus cereus Rock3-29]
MALIALIAVMAPLIVLKGFPPMKAVESFPDFITTAVLALDIKTSCILI